MMVNSYTMNNGGAEAHNYLFKYTKGFDKNVEIKNGAISLSEGATFTNTYVTGKIELTKTLDGNNFSGESETKFELYSDSSGEASMDNETKKLIDTITTNEGTLMKDKLEVGTYFFVETKASEGYVKSNSDYPFEISDKNYREMQSVTMDNEKEIIVVEKGTIAIHKTNADDPKQGLYRAVYGVFASEECKDEDLITKLVTDETGKAVSEMELAFGSYYVKEMEAPYLCHFVIGIWCCNGWITDEKETKTLNCKIT